METVKLTHTAGKGFEELKDVVIEVPASAERVYAKTGWKRAPKAAEKKD